MHLVAIGGSDAGMAMRQDTTATSTDVEGRRLALRDSEGQEDTLAYDELIVGTGAVSARPPIGGLSGADALDPADGVHLLHSMGDTFAVMRTLEHHQPASAVIVGAGYIGLEMAEGLRACSSSACAPTSSWLPLPAPREVTG